MAQSDPEERRALLDPSAKMVSAATQVRRDPRDFKAPSARQGSQGSLDLLERMAHLGRLAHRAGLERLGSKVFLDRRGPRVRSAPLVLRVREAILEPRVKLVPRAWLGHRGHVVPLGMQAHEAIQVPEESRVIRVPVAQPGPQDHKERREHKACVACQVHQARLDPQVPLDRLVRQAHRAHVVAMAQWVREAHLDRRVMTAL